MLQKTEVAYMPLLVLSTVV